MRKFWQRDDVHSLESMLRRQRPEPREQLVDSLVESVHAASVVPRPRLARSRFAAVGFVVALVAFAGFGGLGVAASAVSESAGAAVGTVKSAVSPAKKNSGQQALSANHSSKTKAAETEYDDKQAVCHKGKKTLYLPPSAIPAHLGHGDTLGPCPGDD